MSNLYLISSCAAQHPPQRGSKPGRRYLAVTEASWSRHSDWQEHEQLRRRLRTSHLERGREMLGKTCGYMEADSTTERKQRLENIYQSNGTIVSLGYLYPSLLQPSCAKWLYYKASGSLPFAPAQGYALRSGLSRNLSQQMTWRIVDSRWFSI